MGQSPKMTLNYLDFEYSESEDGAGTFDAMASTSPQQVPAVHAEIALVLGWAHAAFPGLRGPLDEGFEWDFNLQGMREFTAFETLDYHEDTQQLSVTASPRGVPRHTVTLSITGTPGFCRAFRQRFGFD
jgi:hypothetical protein